MKFPCVPRKRRPARRTRRLAALVPANEGLEARPLLASFRWAADVSGDFNTPANWLDANNQPGVPGASDDATVGFGDVTVTSAQPNSVHSLTSSGTLAITANTLTLGAASTTAGLALSGGIINGAGTLTVA